MGPHVPRGVPPALLAALLAACLAGCGNVEVGKALSGATLAGGSGGAGYFDGAAASSSALIRFDAPSAVAVIGTDVFVADTGNHVIRKINAAGDLSTVAGTFGAAGSADGTGAAARFRGPAGLAADGTTLYICDTGNHTIRKLVTTSGAVTTLAGGPGSAGDIDNNAPADVRFSSPRGIVVAGGALFVADTGNHKVRRVTVAGAATTFAGSGTGGSADGLGTAASFSAPEGVAAIGTDLYVADTGNHTVRKVVPSGAFGDVTTIAGSPGVPGTADGPGTTARFSGPTGIATDGSDLFVADTGNHTIRTVTTAGVAATLAGSPGLPGSGDGAGAAARFDSPRAVAASGSILVVADTENHSVRKTTLAGVVTTFAGNPPRAGSADGTGTAARFSGPAGTAVVGDNVFVADAGNHAIRKITPGGSVTTFAGAAGIPGNSDGTGTAARFDGPEGIATDGSALFVADTANHTIRKVTAAGVVTTIAGSPGLPGSVDATGSAARFSSPRGIVAVGTDLYVADTGNHTIRKVTAAGVVTTISGIPGSAGSNDNPAGTSARFNGPRGITVLGSSLYVSDTGNHTVRKTGLSGSPVTPFAGAAGQAGSVDGSGGSARFSSPEGISAVGSVLYVADRGNHAIRRLNTTGSVAFFAGDPAKATTRDGEASLVLLNAPSGVAGSPGVLYFTDANENVVRKILF